MYQQDMTGETEIRETLSAVGDSLLTGPLLESWEVPHKLLLDADGIRYWWSESGADRRVSPPQLGLAWDFKDLAEGSADAIVRFARNWGVIGELKGHAQQLDWPAVDIYRHHATGDKGRREGQWEPLALWRGYSRGIRALLVIGVTLRKGHLMESQDDWRNACDPILQSDVDPLDGPVNWDLYQAGCDARDPAAQRRAFGEILSEWIARVGLRPIVTWELAGPPAHLALSQGSLLETVVADVAFSLTGTRALEVCASCGVLFRPNRLPRGGVRRYCSRCGRKAAVRDATREWRKRISGKDGKEISDVQTRE